MTGERFALVLFDWDGCTAVIETRTLRPKTEVAVSRHVQTVWEGETYLVEVLSLSGSKRTLNAFEQAWSLTRRSESLAAEKASRANDDYGGYLNVWPDDMVEGIGAQEEMDIDDNAEAMEAVEVVEAVETVEALEEPREGRTGQKEGLNGRKVNVLYEGSGDYGNRVRPNRAPMFLDGLSPDQTDLLTLQLERFVRGQRTYATQTETVVILTNEQDLANEKQARATRDMSTQTDVVDFWANIGSIAELLAYLRPGVSKGLMSRAEDTVPSTDEEHSSSISTDNEQSCVPSDDVDNHTPDLQTSVEDINISQLSAIPVAEGSVDMENVRIVIPECLNSSQGRENLAEMQIPEPINRVSAPPLTSSPVYPRRTKRTTTLLPCQSGAILEIGSPLEAENLSGDVELRIAPSLIRMLEASACSRGNFAWLLAQAVFRKEELLCHNYKGTNGKKALCPQKTHAIEHAVLDKYGPSEDNLKLIINAVNSGIRSIAYRTPRQVLAQIENSM